LALEMQEGECTVARAPALRLGAVFCFQAEDGVLDVHVTGVQTCALPIFQNGRRVENDHVGWISELSDKLPHPLGAEELRRVRGEDREERRVGRECSWRGWASRDGRQGRGVSKAAHRRHAPRSSRWKGAGA